MVEMLDLTYAYYCPNCGAEFKYYDTEFREAFIQDCCRCEKKFEVNESNLTWGNYAKKDGKRITSTSK